MALVDTDEIDQIAMFTSRGINPVADAAALSLEQPDIEAASGRSRNVSHHPVSPLAATGG